MLMTTFVDIITEPKIVRTIHVLIITHTLWMGEGGGGKRGTPINFNDALPSCIYM